MSQTISRMYDSVERANAAADALRNHYFIRFTDVHVTSRDTVAGGSAEGIVAALLKVYILKAHARVYADVIQRGGALVTVHAAFGSAVTAVQTLDEFGPIDSGVAVTEDRATPWDDAAPCSSAFGLPVLLSDTASFSRFWNVPALSKKGATTSSALGLPEVSDSRSPFTGTFGGRLISANGTFMSSMLGLPLLTKSRAGRR